MNSSRATVPTAVLLVLTAVYVITLIFFSKLGQFSIGTLGDEHRDSDLVPWKHFLYDEEVAEVGEAVEEPVTSTVDGESAQFWPNFNLTVQLERLPGWASEFSGDAEEHAESVRGANYTDKQQQLRDEIAPWVWHHRGSEDGAATGRENAVIVVLIRNRELEDMRYTLRQFEDRFNRRYHYPYVFLNDKPFSEKFMEYISRSTTSNVTFARIPKEHWSIPATIDTAQAEQARLQMQANNVIYGGSTSYRHMCRFNSGFFYKHPLLEQREYYWRIEPGVDFFCDVDYDPFRLLREKQLKYSFVIALEELRQTIPTLWEHTLRFALARNLTAPLLQFFAADNGDYNLCHFWSNFEIASLSWLRSPQYEDFFNYLDSTGNFFYERWGDAPVHSLAAGLFLRQNEVHFFNDIGYKHSEFSRCPDLAADRALELRCICREKANFDTTEHSCLPRWLKYTEYSWSPDDTRDALVALLARKRHVLSEERAFLAERRRWYDYFGAL